MGSELSHLTAKIKPNVCKMKSFYLSLILTVCLLAIGNEARYSPERIRQKTLQRHGQGLLNAVSNIMDKQEKQESALRLRYNRWRMRQSPLQKVLRLRI